MRKKKKIGTFLIGCVLLCFLILSGIYLYRVKKGIRELEKWEGYINQMVVKYDIPDDQKLVEAIILTETKGQHIDIMQSSESQTGNPNTIFSSEESIESGVKHLADVIHYGEQKEVDKWTSVQAYNFGSQYIDYVNKRGNINTLDLAEEYSKTVLAPSLGNKDATTYRYLTPKAVWYNGGYLYQNGGNIFYADRVKWHLTLIKWLE